MNDEGVVQKNDMMGVNCPYMFEVLISEFHSKNEQQ